MKDTDTGVTVTLEGGATIDAELLLVAVGRGPVSAGLGYEEAGVAMDRGFVLVDEYCRTSVPTISAVGDLIPGLQLAHVGFAEGIVVAERLAGLPVTPIDYDGVPRVTYSDPEVASVGITSATAAERGIEITEFTYDLAGNGKSQILQTQGAAKVIAAAGGGPVLGVHLVGARVGELIAEGQLDLQLGGHAVRRGPAHPPPPDPVGGDRRGASRAGRQAPARARITGCPPAPGRAAPDRHAEP